MWHNRLPSGSILIRTLMIMRHMRNSRRSHKLTRWGGGEKTSTLLLLLLFLLLLLLLLLSLLFFYNTSAPFFLPCGLTYGGADDGWMDGWMDGWICRGADPV